MKHVLSPILIGSIHTAQLGTIWVAQSKRGLVAVEYGVSRLAFEESVRKNMHCPIKFSPLRNERALRQLREYVEGKRRNFRLNIDWFALSSDFQRAVLRVVYSIPTGQTRTYAEVAAEMGHPKAARAVGRANATNPMPLVIPCHRVIGTDGKLHGYGGKGGIRTKEWLLKMESSK